MNQHKHGQFFAHTFSDVSSTAFCAKSYSELKFGSDMIARRFGHEMAEKFFREHRQVLLTQKCVVIPSAFNVVEIAATILARHFMDRLNDLQVRAGGDIVEWTTMHRTVGYLNDYADATAEQRMMLLSQDRLFIKREFIEGKTLLFVDDIHITGTHELMIAEYLKSIGADNDAYFICFARYTGDRAAIEGDLNRCGIRTLPDFLAMMEGTKTHMMVRTLRLWLLAEPDTLRWALGKVDADYVDRLYHAILARGYYKVPELQDGLAIIREHHDKVCAELLGLVVAA